MAERRRCTKCGREKSAAEFKAYRPTQCYACVLEYHRLYQRANGHVTAARWREKNPEKSLAIRKRYLAKQKRGKYRDRKDRYCKTCPVQLTPENNRPRDGRYCTACRKARSAAMVDREKVARRSALWSAANPERRREYLAKFFSNNPRARAVYVGRHRAKFGKVRSGGSLTKSEWVERLNEYNHACAYCLRRDVALTQDHLVAISNGGAHALENVVPACKRCHSRKGTRSIFTMLNKEGSVTC